MRKLNYFLFFLSAALNLFWGNNSLAAEESASFYLSPHGGTFFVGNTFDVSVFVNTEENAINAVQVDLKFPPDLLQVTSPTAGSSFISIWADQPFYSNKDGEISFRGGVIAPGIKTSAGLVSTIAFRAKAPGNAVISFSESSKILLADGKGTDILKSTAQGEYNLVLPFPEGPKIYSPTHPSLTAWYRNNNPVFSIEKQDGVTDFSYVLGQDPTEMPDNISEGMNNFVSFDDVGSGIWYFHAKAKRFGVWGGTSHYPIRIDTMPPEKLEITVESLDKLGNSKFFAYFSAEDNLSGIDYYEIGMTDTNDAQSAANPFFMETASPFQVPFDKSGKYSITVRAFDKAGNFSRGEKVLTVFSPFFSYTENGLRIKNLLFPPWFLYLISAITAISAFLFLRRILKRRNLSKRLQTEVQEAEREIEDVRKLEQKIQEMRHLEEKAREESERLAEKLKDN